MNEFVKDYAKREIAFHFGRQQDIASFVAWLKITRHLCDSAIMGRHIRFKGSVVFEHDHRNWLRRGRSGVGKDLGKCFSELFQSRCDLSDVFLTGVADKIEIF
jgi:hypothetical protein